MQAYKARKRIATLSIGVLALAGMTAAASSAAVVPINLIKAQKFAITTTGGIVNTGASSISGNLGLTQTLNYSDTGLLTVKGDYHFGDSDALGAAADVASAYTTAQSETPTVAIAPELGGVTLTPGIYSSATGFSINGVLTLDAQFKPNAIFVFQTPLALTTGAASKVNLINGAQACNVTWQVGTTSTLGTTSDFKGNLLGKGNFASGAGSVISGRVLVNGGSVSLNNTSIVIPSCKKVDDKDEDGKSIINGGGSYFSTYGKANFNIEASGIYANNAYTSLAGHVDWNVSNTWKFKGSIGTYAVDSAGITTVTGTGPLYYFAKNNKGKDGRWVTAATNVTYTAKYARDKRTDGTLGKIRSVAIGFTGTPVTGAPQLPVLGALAPLTGGGN